jgi:sulfite exporter TauE/SafE
MNDSLGLLGALGAGLLGSGHCFGMCGGIVGAFAMGAAPGGRARPGGLPLHLLAYNLGRVATYAALGALAGLAGGALAGALPQAAARLAGRTLAALFLIGLGLYLLGWPQLLAPFERLGARFWRRLEPLGRRLLSPRGVAHAAALGAIWGWLPCGLVYSMLAVAAASASAARGALVMTAFGLGTLPALMAAGFASGWLHRLARAAPLRRLAAAAYLAAGAWLVASSFADTPHRHAPAAAPAIAPAAAPAPPAPPAAHRHPGGESPAAPAPGGSAASRE